MIHQLSRLWVESCVIIEFAKKLSFRPQFREAKASTPKPFPLPALKQCISFPKLGHVFAKQHKLQDYGEERGIPLSTHPLLCESRLIFLFHFSFLMTERLSPWSLLQIKNAYDKAGVEKQDVAQQARLSLISLHRKLCHYVQDGTSIRGKRLKSKPKYSRCITYILLLDYLTDENNASTQKRPYQGSKPGLRSFQKREFVLSNRGTARWNASCLKALESPSRSGRSDALMQNGKIFPNQKCQPGRPRSLKDISESIRSSKGGGIYFVPLWRECVGI